MESKEFVKSWRVSSEALDRERHKKNEGLRDLPGNTSEVILRFAPNPNGPLSIGHSRGVAINSLYADRYKAKSYSGLMIPIQGKTSND